MKKTALYVRVSKLDQHPEQQKQALLEYAKDKKLDVIEIYEDKVSGAKDSRPNLDKMMSDARLKHFNHVIFWKVDRLGRNAVHTQTIIEEWKNRGVTFAIPTLDIDTSTPTGKFIFGIFAQFAEMERSLIQERTKLKIDYIKKKIEEEGTYRAESGRVISQLGRPFGAKDKNPRSKKGYYK